MTAEQFLKQYLKNNPKGNYQNCMIEFAKIKVTEALKAASEKASMQIEESMSTVRYISHSQGSQTFIVAKDSILNAYPLDLIK